MVSTLGDFDHERFWSKVDKTTTPTKCWPWKASASGSGYPQFRLHGRVRIAHRIAYELMEGEIADGLHLDHLCRNIRCCNPAHLSPCTPRENAMRSTITIASINAAKTTCPRGHKYDIITPTHRGCSICDGREAFRNRSRGGKRSPGSQRRRPSGWRRRPPSV